MDLPPGMRRADPAAGRGASEPVPPKPPTPPTRVRIDNTCACPRRAPLPATRARLGSLCAALQLRPRSEAQPPPRRGCARAPTAQYWCVPGTHCPLERRSAAVTADGSGGASSRRAIQLPDGDVTPDAPELPRLPMVRRRAHRRKLHGHAAGALWPSPPARPRRLPTPMTPSRPPRLPTRSRRPGGELQYPSSPPLPWDELWLRLAGYRDPGRGAAPRRLARASPRAWSPSVGGTTCS